jgi:D-alanine-D-alanine ligase
MDPTKYSPLPVYVNKVGRMFIGPELLDIKFYPIMEFRESQLTEVVIPVGETFPCVQKRFGLFRKKYPFDVAFCAFHGADGESGGFQGLFQAAGIPYTGADIKSSAVYMDKVLTKMICRDLGIKVLPDFTIAKPKDGSFDVKKLAAEMPLPYPVMAKPRSLGSSVGVRRVKDQSELETACLEIFKLGDDVLCEPFVENLAEYNIAVVKNKDGKIITSAIERPNASGDVLSFADKYLSAKGAKKKCPKKMGFSVMPTMELLAERREFCPTLAPDTENFIRESAVKLLTAMGGTGAPRIDFLCNEKTGEIWLGEVNPIPGSFAFHLWVLSEYKFLYGDLVDIIICNANAQNQNIDLKQSASVVFK